MTAYNREKYIAEAIESVLASTYTNFELIIVDDASTDNTVKIAKDFANKDNRIRVYVNEINLTQFPNRNKAAEYAMGWLMFCVDSDDTIKADAIEYVVSQFQKHPDVKFSLIYYKGDLNEPKVMTPAESIRHNYFKDGFLNVGPGGTVIETAFFRSIGGFPEKYGPIGDMYYNVKAAANTNILLLTYDYLYYRRHENQEFNNKYSYLCNGYIYLVDLMKLPELPLSRIERKKILKKFARLNMLNFLKHIKHTGEIKKAFKAFLYSRIGLKEII